MHITFFRLNRLSLVLGAALILMSCSDNSSDCNCSDDNVLGKIVTDSPTQILAFSDVEKLTQGETLFIRLNRSKGIVHEYPITFDATFDYSGERLIFCHTPDKLIIGQGDSGSPILTADGKVVGALCYGFSSNNHQFAARAIEDLKDISTENKRATGTKNNENQSFQTLGAVHFVCGLNAELFARYTKNSPEGMFSKYDKFFTSDQTSLSGLKSTKNEAVIPGQTIGVMEIQGDVLSMGSMGTASLIDENKLYAYGHEASLSGDPLALPVVKASMIVMLEQNLNASYKIALPSGNVVGALTKVAYEGILINTKATPQTFELTSSITIDQDVFNEKHTIAHFEDPEREYYHASNLPGMLVWYHLNDYVYTNKINVTGSITIHYETEQVTIPIDETGSTSSVDYYISRAIQIDMLDNDEHITSQSVQLQVTEVDSTY